MRKVFKVFLVVLGIVGALIFGFYVFLYFAFDGIFSGPSYDKSDLIANYENRKAEITQVRDYYKSILPKGKSVYIEFGKGKNLEIFHLYGDKLYQNNWDLKIGTPKVDSLLNELKWTTNELNTLHKKLDAANCISVAGDEPVNIGWQRSGMGLFSYDIFQNNLDKEQVKEYNDGCMYIFYRDNMVLEYGGGAIGMQCFPEFYRNKNKKQGIP